MSEGQDQPEVESGEERALRERVRELEQRLAALEPMESRPPGVPGRIFAVVFALVLLVSGVAGVVTVVWVHRASAAMSSSGATKTRSRMDVLGEEVTRAIHECTSKLDDGTEVDVRLRLLVSARGAVTIQDARVSPSNELFVGCVRRGAMLPTVLGASAQEPTLDVHYSAGILQDGIPMVSFGWLAAPGPPAPGASSR